MGIWFGVNNKNGQYIYYDIELDSVKHARTLMRVPNPEMVGGEGAGNARSPMVSS